MDFLYLGGKSPAIADLRQLLAKLDYLSGFSLLSVSEAGKAVFDENLQEAVKVFQQQNGLLATGIVDATTWRLLKGAVHSLGSRVIYYRPEDEYYGKDVLDLQTKLHDLGFYYQKLDARFGKATEEALCNYQHEFGLKVDGVLGPVTCNALGYLDGLTINSGSLQAIQTDEYLRAKGPLLKGKVIAINPSAVFTSSNLAEDTLALAAQYLTDITSKLIEKMQSLGITTKLLNEATAVLPATDIAHKANQSGADILISLHTAYYPTPKPNGISSFYFGSSNGLVSVSGEKLARLIQRELATRTPLNDNRYHGRTWEVLRLAKMTTIWIDTAYISNPTDLNLLDSESNRDKIAEAILVGIKRFYLLDQDLEATGTMELADLLREEIKYAD